MPHSETEATHQGGRGSCLSHPFPCKVNCILCIAFNCHEWIIKGRGSASYRGRTHSLRDCCLWLFIPMFTRAPMIATMLISKLYILKSSMQVKCCHLISSHGLNLVCQPSVGSLHLNKSANGLITKLICL